jgi:hypothetical protein
LKKHKRAVKGVLDTKPPFDELSLSLDPTKIAAWELDEKTAMKQRGEYLDIYQLRIDQGQIHSFSHKSVADALYEAPTMAEIRLRLTKSENTETGRSGSVPWIIQGINLEDAQYVVDDFWNTGLNSTF